MEKGYDVEVVGIDLPEMYCPICLLLMCNPIQFECSHALCEPCFEGLKTTDEDDNEDEGKPLCPTCRRVINVEKTFKDRMMQRMILAVTVKCYNQKNGCVWTGVLGNINGHLDFCEAALIPCTFDSCLENFLRKDMPQHQGVCEFRKVTCIYCDEEHVFKEETTHVEICKEYPIQCKFGCGNDVSRNQANKHYEECGARTVACPYQCFGCDKQVLWKDLEHHSEEDAQFHLSLTTKTIALQNNKFNEIVKTFEKKLDKLENKILSRFDELENHLGEKKSFGDIVGASVEPISQCIDNSTALMDIKLKVSQYSDWLKSIIQKFDQEAMMQLSFSHFNDFQERVKKKHVELLLQFKSIRNEFNDAKDISYAVTASNIKHINFSINPNIHDQLKVMESSLKNTHAELAPSLKYEQRFLTFSRNLQNIQWSNYSCVWKIDMCKLPRGRSSKFYRTDGNIIKVLNCDNHHVTSDCDSNDVSVCGSKECNVKNESMELFPQLWVTRNEEDLIVWFNFYQKNNYRITATVKLLNQIELAELSPRWVPFVSYLPPKNGQYLYTVKGTFCAMSGIDLKYKKDGNIYINFVIVRNIK